MRVECAENARRLLKDLVVVLIRAQVANLIGVLVAIREGLHFTHCLRHEVDWVTTCHRESLSLLLVHFLDELGQVSHIGRTVSVCKHCVSDALEDATTFKCGNCVS